jgi:hypothetical protein
MNPFDPSVYTSIKPISSENVYFISLWLVGYSCSEDFNNSDEMIIHFVNNLFRLISRNIAYLMS